MLTGQGSGWQRLLAVACLGGALMTGIAVTPSSAREEKARSHTVYVCVKVAQVWLRPGHHSIGMVLRGDRFTITRYSPTKRWAYGVGVREGTEQQGWVRHSALCRHKPASARD